MRHLAFLLDQVRCVPVDGALQTLADAKLRLVAEEALRFSYVGARILEITLARLAEYRLDAPQMRQALRHEAADLVEQLEQRRLVAVADVVGLVLRLGLVAHRRQQV